MHDAAPILAPVLDADSMARANGQLILPRWAATFLDTVVVLALYIAVGVISQGEGAWPLPLWGLSVVAYYVLLEGRWGATLGKLVMKLRVVGRDGRPPGYWRAVIRTVFRLIEVNPLLAGGLPAALVVWLSKAHQRLGDVVAGTYVLQVEDVKKLRSSVDTSVF
jgi:uncharacterized RDD family membrane protein YckC